ncbi:glucose 1-dehydrogenase [Paenibacillus sp. N1-5-1-14]|uniref:SDR family NAD(P)-dependent oxidoreductase n=1 Tax=Paenibacillus radicibacter TaxID=2972488 RepID=UPI002158B48B|nr:glucose 1-dehydrogenase [Paenibacillus radicibacter]MCR8642749.1 glucose 1-dehydrogenase [Paenibacillus radicibacter]
MARLQGKVAIITGAAMGQGAAEAKLFAQEGAKVVATDLQEDKLQAVVAEIQAAGGEAIAVKHNVTSEEDWIQVVESAVQAFGKVDILVNNAGILVFHDMESMPVSDLDKILNINVKGTLLGMKHVIPQMKQVGGGSIVNIASAAAIVSTGTSPSYSASKGAVRAASKEVAVSYGKDNIRVNSVYPGTIVTPMIEGVMADPSIKGMVEASTPMRRVGRPEEIAYGVLFLASDEASFVTGAELVIDGGWTSQ